MRRRCERAGRSQRRQNVQMDGRRRRVKRMRWQGAPPTAAPSSCSGRSRCQTARAALPCSRQAMRVPSRAPRGAHVAGRARQAARAEILARTQRALRGRIQVVECSVRFLGPSHPLACWRRGLALPPVIPVLPSPVRASTRSRNLASRRRMTAIHAVDRTTARRRSA